MRRFERFQRRHSSSRGGERVRLRLTRPVIAVCEALQPTAISHLCATIKTAPIPRARWFTPYVCGSGVCCGAGSAAEGRWEGSEESARRSIRFAAAAHCPRLSAAPLTARKGCADERLALHG